MEQDALRLRLATAADAHSIREVASAAWWHTYPGILSDDAISTVLQTAYSDETIATSLKDGQQWLLAENAEGECVGFCATEYFPDKYLIFVHKLYVHPARQGGGAGKKLMAYAASLKPRARLLQLLVNRANHKAQRFYLKQGLQVKQAVTVIAGPGFLKEDFLMERVLQHHHHAEDEAPTTQDVVSDL